jgi:hypothetical protein
MLFSQVTDVDEKGAILVYRSVRDGFAKYLMGNFKYLFFLIQRMNT